METLLARGPLIRRFLKKPETPILINTIFMSDNLIPKPFNNGLDLGLQGLRNKLEENIKPKDPLSDQPKGKERFWDNLTMGFKRARQSLVVGAIAFSGLAFVMLGTPPPEAKGDITPVVQTSTPTFTENKTMVISTPTVAASAAPDPGGAETPASTVQPPAEKPQTIIENNPSTAKPVEQTVENETLQIPKGSTAWEETRIMYVKIKGFEPTNTQIMEATIEFVKENNIAVKEWHIKGSISDRKISPYQTFKATGMIKRVLQA